uniref:Integrase catalytic domain-containing protein n=1 Tax=Tanacetum cinerariifolium TaxID=118510 RepID=A0A6L2N3A2_TANCI|nr:hypothetical protein [Tanacetum cinerariifolium]
MKKMYYLVVTYDYSRFSWVFFLATKDETSEILKAFITGIENLIDHKVKIIRYDNGTGFKNKEMNKFRGEKRIKREFSVARTPQHNEVAERKNRTLIEAARTMLDDSKTASLSFMRPFGSPVTILNTLDPLGKFDGKADEGFFVGYSVNSKAYRADEGFLVGYSVNSKAFRVFKSRTKIVQETLHINFLKNKPNVAKIGPKWLFAIDTLTKSMNYQPVVAGNQPNDNAGIQENLDAGKVGKESVSTQQYVLLPLWSTSLQGPHKIDDDAAFDVKKNENDVHVSTSRSDKTAEFEEFSSNSTNRVNGVSSPVNAVGPNSTNSITNFNTASPSDTAVSPNFGIARNSSFVNPSKYSDDPDMPELEDIVYSNNEEDVGAEANLSNLETNISVSPIPTTKVYKDHPVTQIIGDLTSALQTRSMTRMVKEQGRLHQINDEDFHTCMFACFLSQEEPKKVHQALKDPSWIKAMQEELL